MDRPFPILTGHCNGTASLQASDPFAFGGTVIMRLLWNLGDRVSERQGDLVSAQN